MKTTQQPFPELAQNLGIEELWLKREDTHPYGSHKGRGIPLMMREYHKREGIKNFVISSSGNAALAAAITVQKHHQNNPGDKITLRIFIGTKIDPEKLKRLKVYVDNEAIFLEQVENPKQTAFLLDKKGEAKNLRQSTDDLALKGYFELAEELDKIPNLTAIFIPTSSGTTAQGLAVAFDKLTQHPEIHIVQTTSCHPIAEALSSSPGQDNTASLATAIVDKIAHRKTAVVEKVTQSKGTGWIVTNDEITSIQKLTKNLVNFPISGNSALSLAAIKKATASGRKFSGAVVALITGA